MTPPALSPGGPHSTPQLSSIRDDGGRLAIHPLEVKGRFITSRRIVFAVLFAIYLAAPLVKIGGHPAVHLDVDARRFYLLGGTFNAQDFWMVLLLTTGFVFSVLFVTAWRGRLWCGWGCPQTVFLEGLYRPIERLFDGPSSRRNKLKAQPWSAGRVVRSTLKHLAYFAVSVAIAHVAAAVFVSVHDLAGMIREGPIAHLAAFTWTSAFTLLLYFNFGWFREQFCVVLCPYGRLQSVLHDRDSITVAYDVARGEPRGRLSVAKTGLPRSDAPSASPPGDCVDCKKCVQACPTAIDIRNGLQMECLACAQCIDACDEVMVKIHKPKGLIRYASMNELAGQRRRVVRARLFVYAALASIALGVLTAVLVLRTPFEANVARLPGVPFVVEGDRVRNQFDVHVINKSPEVATLTLEVVGPAGLEVSLGTPMVQLASLEGAHVPLVLSLPRAAAHGTRQLQLKLTAGDGTSRISAVPFVAPR